MLSNISDSDREIIQQIFEKFRKNLDDAEYIFYNMCFAICAPQAKFSKNLFVIQKLKEYDFYHKDISDDILIELVKNVRFHRKAKYLKIAKSKFSDIYNLIKSNAINPHEKRDILVKMIPGVGLKAASHFMRNLGYDDFAIIDTHILKFLNEKSPKNRNEYLNLEYKFIILSNVNNLSPGAADAYVWKVYSKTKWEDFKY
jgi:N-glycosylase/DNA lyase